MDKGRSKSRPIDANGIVNVSAKDKATGKEQQIRIQASGGLNDEEIEKMVHDAESNAEEDKKRKELVEARNHGESMAHSVEKMLEEHGDKITADEKGAIETEIADLRTALAAEDIADINAKMEKLSQASMKLGEAVYKESQAQAPDIEPDADNANEGDQSDNVVDADFEEVDDEKNKRSN